MSDEKFIRRGGLRTSSHIETLGESVRAMERFLGPSGNVHSPISLRDTDAPEQGEVIGKVYADSKTGEEVHKYY
jgi:hypothetical protein